MICRGGALPGWPVRRMSWVTCSPRSLRMYLHSCKPASSVSITTSMKATASAAAASSYSKKSRASLALLAWWSFSLAPKTVSRLSESSEISWMSGSSSTMRTFQNLRASIGANLPELSGWHNPNSRRSACQSGERASLFGCPRSAPANRVQWFFRTGQMERAKGGGAAPDPGWHHSEPVLGPDWIVLIVDDDQDIHAAIRLAVGRGRFFGRKIEFCSASSGAEALRVVSEIDRSRLVLAFVDVIMEHDTAGLELVGKLRSQFGTPLQIVLNTGQPHLTPAEEAARKYEISGYLSKLEATPERLRTVIHVAIRNFRKFRAMQVLCDSLSDFVTLFESATSTKALDKLLSSALLQYGSVWQFSYVLFRDLFAPDVESGAGPREKEALQQLLGLRIHATGVFSKLSADAERERWGIVIKPLGGRFEAGLAIDSSGRPSEVLIRELQVLLRSWALTRESIELKLLAAEDQRLREVMYR